MLHVAGDGYKKGTAAAVKSSREFSPVEKQFRRVPRCERLIST